jgi:hypothetical protein
MASNDAPGYDDADLTAFFNKAQKVFTKQLVSEYSNAANDGTEETEKRSKDLVELKDHSVVTVFVSGDHPNSYICDLPDTFWLTLKEECTITYTNSCNTSVTERIPVKPIKEDYYNANIKNPFKKPYEELIWRIDRERGNIAQGISLTNRKRHELVLFTGATISDYRVSYYRRPKTIDLSNNNDFCEFDPMHHEKIADIAVELMYQTTGKQEFQSKVIENNKIIE